MESISPYKKDNEVLNLSFQFALQVIVYTEKLEALKRYNMANQLFKSGTAIQANIREAQNAERKSDFIHKMKVAAKEAEETEGWLLLCHYSASYPDIENVAAALTSILKLVNKIIGSSKRN